jgi:hypothetical protein
MDVNNFENISNGKKLGNDERFLFALARQCSTT